MLKLIDLVWKRVRFTSTWFTYKVAHHHRSLLLATAYLSLMDLFVCIFGDNYLREDFTRLKKVVEKKREAAAREQELKNELAAANKLLETEEAIAATAAVSGGEDTMLDEFDTQEQGDVYF